VKRREVRHNWWRCRLERTAVSARRSLFSIFRGVQWCHRQDGDGWIHLTLHIPYGLQINYTLQLCFYTRTENSWRRVCLLLWSLHPDSAIRGAGGGALWLRCGQIVLWWPPCSRRLADHSTFHHLIVALVKKKPSNWAALLHFMASTFRIWAAATIHSMLTSCLPAPTQICLPSNYYSDRTKMFRINKQFKQTHSSFKSNKVTSIKTDKVCE